MWYWLWSWFNLIGTVSTLGASFEETVICIPFARHPPFPFPRTHLLHLFGRRNKFLSSTPALQPLILPDLSAISIAKHHQGTRAKRADWAQEAALLQQCTAFRWVLHPAKKRLQQDGKQHTYAVGPAHAWHKLLQYFGMRVHCRSVPLQASIWTQNLTLVGI